MVHSLGTVAGADIEQCAIAGYATPFLYIYLILKFESDVPRNALMLWAFFLGLAVDILSILRE